LREKNMGKYGSFAETYSDYKKPEVNIDSPIMEILKNLASCFVGAGKNDLGYLEGFLIKEGITEKEIEKFQDYWMRQGDFFPKPKEFLHFVASNKKSSRKETDGCQFDICKGDGFIGIVIDGEDRMGHCCACKVGVERFGRELKFSFNPNMEDKKEYIAQFEKSRLTAQNKIEIKTHIGLKERSKKTMKNPIQRPPNITNLKDIKDNDMASLGGILGSGAK
jgi:hypothetical protein